MQNILCLDNSKVKFQYVLHDTIIGLDRCSYTKPKRY